MNIITALKNTIAALLWLLLPNWAQRVIRIKAYEYYQENTDLVVMVQGREYIRVTISENDALNNIAGRPDTKQITIYIDPSL